MIPKILKNFNVYVDGRGYAGRVEEITLPKLTIKTEEFLGAGMAAPVEIDMGMEKLEMEITFAEYDTEIFKLFGLESVFMDLETSNKNHEMSNDCDIFSGFC